MSWGRTNKFKAQRTNIDGVSFASKGEAGLYLELKAQEKRGEIKDVRLHPSFRLTRAQIAYKADFAFFDPRLGEDVVAEYKGTETERWRLIKKLWKVYGPTRLRVYKGYSKSLKVVEEIIPNKG